MSGRITILPSLLPLRMKTREYIERIEPWSGLIAFGSRFRWRRSDCVILERCPLEGWRPGQPGPRKAGTPFVAARGRLRKAAPLWPAPWPVGGVFAPKWWPRERPVSPEAYDPVPAAALILLDAQRVAGGDAKALLAFVNKWGPLGIGVPGDRNFLDGVVSTGHALTELKEWLDALHGLQSGRRLRKLRTPGWLAAIDQRIDELEGELASAPRKRTPTRPLVEDEGRKVIFPAPRMSRSEVRKLLESLEKEKRQPPMWTWRDLAFRLSENVRTVTLGAYPVRGGLVPLNHPRNLLDLLWLEAWRQATGADKLHQCPECHVVFTPRRMSQKYCAHLCANRPTVRKWKLRQRLKKRGVQTP